MSSRHPADPSHGDEEDHRLSTVAEVGPHDEAYCASCSRSFAPGTATCPDDGAKLVAFAAEKDELIGRVLDDRYEICAALGSGGMGTVYRGKQRSVGRDVAIKVVHPALAKQRDTAKRFLREARLASRLSAPRIVNVIDFGQSSDGVLFLVMELLRGRTLAAELARGALPVRRIVAIAIQLCEALEAAHAEAIVHRDLKPGNIVIAEDASGRDAVKVLDFGLAKAIADESQSAITNSQAMLGTPLYMAPEQIRSEPSDLRSDLYALGCIVHEMLSGRPPFVGATVTAVLAMHMEEPPPAPPASVPPELARLVGKLLEKDPATRPTSAAEVRNALEALHVGFATPAAGVATVSAHLADTHLPEPVRGDAPTIQADAISAPIAVPRSLDAPIAGKQRIRTRFALVIGVVAALGGGAAIARFKLMGDETAAPGPSAKSIDPAPATRGAPPTAGEATTTGATTTGTTTGAAGTATGAAGTASGSDVAGSASTANAGSAAVAPAKAKPALGSRKSVTAKSNIPPAPKPVAKPPPVAPSPPAQTGSGAAKMEFLPVK